MEAKSKKENLKKTIKSRIMKIISFAICFIIIVGVIVNFMKYFSEKKDKKKSLEQGVEIKLDDECPKIDLVGLLDSYGVPYSAYVEQSFMDLIEAELCNDNKLNSRLDLYNLYINKTWHLDGIFDNRVTINEMIDMKNFSLDFVRYKYKERVKPSLSYEYDMEHGEQSVYDYVSSLDNPVVLYSCSANDLFYYYGTSLESATLEEWVELLKNLENGLDFLEGNVNDNIETLIDCNYQCQVFVMGLYVPSDNFILNRLGTVVIDKINNRLKTVCNKYSNVYYVDVSSVSFAVLDNDFHPDQDGQKIIASKLAASISENLKRPKEYYVSRGDKGVVKQDVVSSDDFLILFKECELPKRDYVEYAVAIEWVLDALDCKNVTFECLVDIEDDIIANLDEGEDLDLFRKGYNVVKIEHKILDGMIESRFSLHPETKKNDKLSLIKYYK